MMASQILSENNREKKVMKEFIRRYGITLGVVLGSILALGAVGLIRHSTDVSGRFAGVVVRGIMYPDANVVTEEGAGLVVLYGSSKLGQGFAEAFRAQGGKIGEVDSVVSPPIYLHFRITQQNSIKIAVLSVIRYKYTVPGLSDPTELGEYRSVIQMGSTDSEWIEPAIKDLLGQFAANAKSLNR